MNGDLDVLKRLRLATSLFDNLIRSSRFAKYVLSGGTGEPVPGIDDINFFNNIHGGHLEQLKEAVQTALSAASLGLAMAAAELTSSSSSSCSIDKLAKPVATLCRVCAFLILFMKRFLKPEVFSDAAHFEIFRLWYTLSAAKSGTDTKSSARRA